MTAVIYGDEEIVIDGFDGDNSDTVFDGRGGTEMA